MRKTFCRDFKELIDLENDIQLETEEKSMTEVNLLTEKQSRNKASEEDNMLVVAESGRHRRTGSCSLADKHHLSADFVRISLLQFQKLLKHRLQRL